MTPRRKLFPLSKSSLEINAWITTVFFRWLVGPMTLERKEVALPGREPEPMMVGVKIEKCRYLQASGCVGMCVKERRARISDDFARSTHVQFTGKDGRLEGRGRRECSLLRANTLCMC